jgi:ABC-type glycerol-3-phosphate transport system permease component
MNKKGFQKRTDVPDRLPHLRAVAHLLDGQHERSRPTRKSCPASPVAGRIHLGQLQTIFTDPSWYSGYINSLIYVAINMVISLTVALPAAYAFSRYSFMGDKHVFFWLLTNRMTPPAVFLLPFFQLYTTVG